MMVLLTVSTVTAALLLGCALRSVRRFQFPRETRLRVRLGTAHFPRVRLGNHPFQDGAASRNRRPTQVLALPRRVITISGLSGQYGSGWLMRSDTIASACALVTIGVSFWGPTLQVSCRRHAQHDGNQAAATLLGGQLDLRVRAPTPHDAMSLWEKMSAGARTVISANKATTP
jgi:hypothetical protein